MAASLVSGGFTAHRLVEGVIACSIEEAVFSTGQALRRGAHAVLLAPPFYFRKTPDEAVFAWYEEVFRALGRDLRDIPLYLRHDRRSALPGGDPSMGRQLSWSAARCEGIAAATSRQPSP